MKRSTAITRKLSENKLTKLSYNECHAELVEARHERRRRLSILREAQRNNFQSWISPMKHCLVTLMLLVLSVGANAQTPTFAALMKKVSQQYESADSYKMQVRCDIFNPSLELIQTMNGEVVKSGDRYFSDFNNIKSLFNRKCLLQVDESNKHIVYDKNRSNTGLTGISIQDQLADLEGLKASVSKTSKGDYKVFIDMEDNPVYSKTELLISSGYALKKIIYHYSKENQSTVGKSEVTFYNITFNEAIPQHQFSEQRFVQIIGGELQPAGKYKNYELIDLSTLQIPSL